MRKGTMNTSDDYNKDRKDISARPDWDEYFMSIAHVVKTRANCASRKIGSLLVRDKQIISTGYNGTPRGIKNCDEGGCERCMARVRGEIKSGEGLKNCACCHAEENAIIQAALHGIRTEGATLFTTFTPCTQCAKMIINAGVKKVVAEEDYPDDLGTTLLNGAGITLIKITLENKKQNGS